MISIDAINFYDKLSNLGIEVWIDGGWGVDALLGKQTRSHRDLDIAIQQKDVAPLQEMLRVQGYREIKRDSPWNFVLGDGQGHEIDVHAFVFDDRGEVVQGTLYPKDSLAGSGTINGRVVKCVSPEYMVKFHTGYKLRDTDFKDVAALCERFGIDYPAEYQHLKK